MFTATYISVLKKNNNCIFMKYNKIRLTIYSHNVKKTTLNLFIFE